MKKGIHPQMQWVSYVSPHGRLMPVMVSKINQVGKTYHLRAGQLKAQALGNIAKFRMRYAKKKEEEVEKKERNIRGVNDFPL